MHRVLRYFTDIQDNGFAYHEGDTFPREGITVSKERLKELSSSANRRKMPVIEEVKEKKKDVDTDMSRDSELVQPKSADTKRKDTDSKRKTNSKRVSGKDTK